MFRQAATRVLSRSSRAAARARPFSTDLPAAASPDETFVEAWKKVIPNIEPPKTPLSFMTPRPATPSSIPSKLTVNFVLPYASELSTKEVSCIVHFKGFLTCSYCDFKWVYLYGYSCIAGAPVMITFGV